ncbi:MAG: NAD(P)H-dependent oxidoreductase [Brevibacterium yomogidense]|uniref:NAD(P)H-dependent oxidoreductase n=1 Tax=Brevibacterium sp. Mu109 TaxID=1255669 RepID=UPI000C4C9A25|nr:NAD(P)H-dependent oxidoreductase [Brevibacterium sp. Mu109]SMX91501.1 NAD(P)H dehydrogenase (quinone) [Brevibacterium sp. Mu109]
MNILWIFAHPDQDSLNSALRDEGLAPLTEAGHSHRVSDLYAMGWKPTLDRGDLDHDDPAGIGRASGHAYDRGTLSEDITAEQEKLDWADAVVFQFPLWWYAPPAILKGWIDRVFVKGYAYGVTDPDHPGRTLRYGEGVLSGKRALVLTSIGGPEPAFGPRGINGQLDQVLFPLLHGTFWYTGMSVLPPVAVYGANRLDDQQYRAAADTIRRHVTAIGETGPIPYRSQNGGDYDEELVLRPALAPDHSGLAVHSTRQPGTDEAGPARSEPTPSELTPSEFASSGLRVG